MNQQFIQVQQKKIVFLYLKNSVDLTEKNRLNQDNSQLANGFYCGYSPERINPGDKEHTVTKSGSTPEIGKKVDELYASWNSSTIKVAKVIAFVNELAIIFNKLGINTNDVLEFRPGLVGGHCIGVDLTHKAQSIGYNPEIILAGRRLNVANQVIKKGHKIEGSKVLVLSKKIAQI